MATPSEMVKLLLPLLAAVYLGFYVFGLIMGVFSPFGEIGLTIGAAVCAIGLVLYAVARRRGVEPVSESSRLGRSARAQREHRGW